MAGEPLLSADLESGQAAAALKTGKAAANESCSDDILPNISELGRTIGKLAKEHPEILRVQYEWAVCENPEKWAAWVHYYSTYVPAVLRLIKIQFLRELQELKGKGNIKEGMSTFFLAVTGGNLRLIKTIQVAENVKSMASRCKGVYELLSTFLPTVQHTILNGLDGVDNTADSFEVEVMLKFVHLFCLMALYAIPPIGTHLLNQFNGVNPKIARVILADPQELLRGHDPPKNDYYPLLQGKWQCNEPAGIPAPASLTFKDYIHANLFAKFEDLPSSAFESDEWDADPLHSGWLNLDSGLVFAAVYYFSHLVVNDNGNLTQEKLLTEFVDALSSSIGELKNELEKVQAMRAKIISSVSTAFLSALTVLMHWTAHSI